MTIHSRVLYDSQVVCWNVDIWFHIRRTVGALNFILIDFLINLVVPLIFNDVCVILEEIRILPVSSISINMRCMFLLKNYV